MINNIPTESMTPTIDKGSVCISNRLAYRKKEPQRGDIIVFELPIDQSEIFVKRIIGLPGEKVVIKNSNIYINDSTKPLEEEYLVNAWTKDNDEYEFNVPENCYLVLGDNRVMREI